MRPSKENQILELLSLKRDGFLWRELIGRHKWCEASSGEILRGEMYLPRKTLGRNLKKLIEKGIVEKSLEPRRKGERGRQAMRYKIAPKHWCSWGCLYVKVPVRRIGSRWFPGKRYKRLGTESVRVSGSWKKDYENHKKWLKEHDPQEYEKWLKSERRKM